MRPFLRTRSEGARKVEAVHAYLGEPEARVQCDQAGELVLLGVELDAWRALTLSRGSHIGELIAVDTTGMALQRFAKDARGAFAAWSDSLVTLRD